MEEIAMIKELLKKNIIGILGISLTTVTGIIAYQFLTGLFIEAVVASLNAMPH
jgi:hypothetical protein